MIWLSARTAVVRPSWTWRRAKNVSLNTLMATLAALGKGLAIIDARPDIDQISSLLDPADED